MRGCPGGVGSRGWPAVRAQSRWEVRGGPECSSPVRGRWFKGGKLGLPPTAELLFQFPFLGTIKYLRPW